MLFQLKETNEEFGSLKFEFDVTICTIALFLIPPRLVFFRKPMWKNYGTVEFMFCVVNRRQTFRLYVKGQRLFASILSFKVSKVQASILRTFLNCFINLLYNYVHILILTC